MFGWFRKVAPSSPEIEQPKPTRRSLNALHPMFADLIAAIDADDLTRNPPSAESDPPGAGGALSR